MLHKISPSTVQSLAAGCLLLVCTASSGNIAQAWSPQGTPPARVRQRVAAPKAAPPRDADRPIWAGEFDGIRIGWTTSDLYVHSGRDTRKLFTPLAKKGFEDFIALLADEDQADAAAPGVACDYKRTFKVLSVVGTLLSFEDRYYAFCGGAHPTVDRRFTTVNLAGGAGDLRYDVGEETSLMDVNLARPGRAVKLTDYFDEGDILRALLSDPVVKDAFAGEDAPEPPQALEDLPKRLADNFYRLGESGFELRPDYMTRFAFHHIEGDKVAVRLGLPPHYGANHALHRQLGLMLPIPASLRKQLVSASNQQNGFLMQDASKIANGRVTTLSLRTNSSGQALSSR